MGGTLIKAYLSLCTSVHCWFGPLGHTRCLGFEPWGWEEGAIESMDTLPLWLHFNQETNRSAHYLDTVKKVGPPEQHQE